MSKKKISLFIGIILIISVSLFLYINGLDETKIRYLESKLLENEYISSVDITKDDNAKVFSLEGKKSYPYQIAAYPSSKFIELSDDEKLLAMESISKQIDETTGTSSLVECGRNKYCSIQDIYVMGRDENDDLVSYVIPYEYDQSADDLAMEVIGTGGNKTITLNSSSDKSKKSGTSKVSIEKHNAKYSGNFISVIGTVKNNTSSPLSYIEVKVSFYNENGEFQDTKTTYVNSSDALLPNEQKSFDTMVEMIGEKYTKYKIEVVNYSN